MQNPNTFDEASAATKEMFANEQVSLADVPPADTETPTDAVEQRTDNSLTEEAPAETTPPGTEEPSAQQQTAGQPTDTIEQAIQTAEAAAQAASEKDAQLKQALQDIENLKRQNEQLQGTIDEISERNAENLAEEALTPPTLDINGLAFADAEEQKAAMTKYAEEMSDYNRRQLMKELSPALEYAKRGMQDAEKAETLKALSQVPELAGIYDMLPQLDRIIENNKWLSSADIPTDEKYINAFAVAKGINSINNPPAPPKEPTAEELLALYDANPAFRELVEKKRIENLKQSRQVPPFSASSGAVNAALDIKEKPQTLEEASKRTREMFGR